MVETQEAKVNLDTGAYCTCFGKAYLKSIVPDWEENLIPIQGVKSSSASESINPLGIIDLTLIFHHPSQCIRVKVEFLVMENCTSNNFILGKDYCSIYGIDISNQKDRYFTIGDNKRQKVGSLHISTVIKTEEPNPEKHSFMIEKLTEVEFNQQLIEKIK
ncbi:hypothetical protein O181_116075 [Austropuccinia psidii MF-1]|uniref:Uncharacterized protein n=1 Tax=Austropuccinia psidii MF-1 TaxID=1389203 RepID=A0A9Q3K7P5_9BASI|nr:hypothetical protein [Austropuccinia psidii MF-1]